MKILHLINDMNIGGAQRLLADLLPLQAGKEGDYANKANEVCLCMADDIADPTFMRALQGYPGIKIEILNPGNKKGLKGLLTKIRRLRQVSKNYDICHVHLFPSLYIAALANFGRKAKLVYTEHSSFNRRRNYQLLHRLEKIIYSRYASIINISRATRNNLALWLGIPNTNPKLALVENGIPVDKFIAEKETYNQLPRNELNKLRKEIMGRSGTPVLMISRFVESKDQPTLIKAIAEIPDPDVFLVLVGDGPRYKEFEQLAESLGVKDRVVFMGSRSDISRLISISEIGVQSSNWEGFGLTVVEMMAGCLPVVVSDVPGLANVAEGVCPLFKRGDYKTLAQLIQMLIDSPDERLKLIETQKKRAHDFDIKIMASAYMKIYQDILNPVTKKM